MDEIDKTSLAKKQDVLDNHDEEFSILLRTQQLIHKCSSASDTGSCKIISRNLADLKARINKIQTAFATLRSLRKLTCIEQLQDFKSELGAIRQSVLSMSTADAGDLSETISGLDKEIFDVSIEI